MVLDRQIKANSTISSTTIPIDEINLKIIRLLSMDCRTPYLDMVSMVGITPHAIKTRISKMLAQGIIQNFVAIVNPAIFGYEKQCILTIRNIGKKIREDEIIKKISLVGDLRFYTKQLGGAALFSVLVKGGSEDKIGLMVDILKPAVVDYKLLDLQPVYTNIINSDLKIINSLLSNARIDISTIATATSLSTRTVTRRLEKLKEYHVVDFTIFMDLSSMHLVGYIQFIVLMDIDKSLYEHIVKRVYTEFKEYLIAIPNVNQSEFIFALFYSPNIPAIELILTRLLSIDGVDSVELFIMTKMGYYIDWLKREIRKRLKPERTEMATMN
ncbi:MAG TPA: AsnC family transcriptional regulator [Nitrososphaeraceae archaeon]|jgi:DNA-binding Lrp family transcriptional regulator